jgi:hypothetical protein
MRSGAYPFNRASSFGLAVIADFITLRDGGSCFYSSTSADRSVRPTRFLASKHH